MKTFSIDTLGCKVNQYESQQVRELLERLGLSQIRTCERPDLVVINTCCVTGTASAKSRQRIRRAGKLSPGAVIIACGCLPSIRTAELNNPTESVRIIRHRTRLAVELAQIVQGKTTASCPTASHACPHSYIKPQMADEIKYKKNLVAVPQLMALKAFKGHTRAFIKVQDGCDGCCSYCIVPKTRSVLSSRPSEMVIREARDLVAAGHKEIVLTGVFIGAYGQESVRRTNWPNGNNEKLALLLEQVSQIPGLSRIRLSSLEPADVTPRLLDTFCRCRNIMPHLHLSLQSGSDTVLERMCRQYGRDDFRSTIGLIKDRLDRPAITTDLIVGFPGETDTDFEQTMELASEAGFAKIHVFSFSARPGTAAAKMQDVVDKRVVKRRSAILRQLDRELGYEFRQQFVGQPAEVLVEDDGQMPAGRTERYFKVRIHPNGHIYQKNQLVRVELTANSADAAMGRVINNAGGCNKPA